MGKAEKFIEDYTRNCSNIEYTQGVYTPSYQPWLTPDEARKAVEIAREEMISKLRKWVSSKNERDWFTFGYIDRHFDELLKQAINNHKIMAEKPVEFKVLRKNSYGHRWILEPKERIKFREKCKYNKLGTMCDKGYECYVDGGVLLGCTPDVSCPRLRAWDKKHGLERPFTMVENIYPDLKPTTFTWHPATESPGKKRVLMAFTRKDLAEGQYVFESVRFFSPDVRPAECTFRDSEGRKQLPVAWAYYDEVIKGIAPWMISGAENAAWAWWPDKEDNKQED